MIITTLPSYLPAAAASLILLQDVHYVGLLHFREASQNVLWAGTLVSRGKLKVIHSVIT
jgi:hypothetical protein